jgi:2,3-bisphosphoglycerate-independent phosphoglycerate mutase
MNNIKNAPVVLIIMDGWGVAEPSKGNAILLAQTPYLDRLKNNYPYMSLGASGEVVGLPWGEAGNSEVGHLNLGAGKIVYQDLLRISVAISDGSFFENEVFLKSFEHVKKNKSTLHLMGLLGPGGVHADDEQLYALLKLAKSNGVEKVYIHLFLDGRDSPQTSAPAYLERLDNIIEEYGIGKVATLTGRFYAMDRDQIWERTEEAYRALVYSEGEKTNLSPEEAVKEAYKHGQTDEFIKPIIFAKDKKPIAAISDNDSVIFYNFRPDRTRQLSAAFVKESFNFFERKKFKNLFFVTMTEYDREFPSEVAFPPIADLVKDPLGLVLSDNRLSQFHLAETQKWAHVTLFFNGMRDQPFKNEDRKLIPSLKIVNFAEKPAMSAYEINKCLKEKIESDLYEFIVVNFANPDMVGHTGNLEAAIKACEVVDECVGKTVELILQKNGIALVTADHGNAEQMINPQTGRPDTEHTTNPVPLILVSPEARYKLRSKNSDVPAGILGDVGTTALDLLDIMPAEEMTGLSLLVK